MLGIRNNVPIDSVEPGDVLSEPVFDSSGNILLPAGAVLTQRRLHHLRSNGITALRLADPEHPIERDPAPIDWHRFLRLRSFTETEIRNLSSRIDEKVRVGEEPVVRNHRSRIPTLPRDEKTLRRCWYQAVSLRRKAIEVCRDAFVRFAGGNQVDFCSLRDFISNFVSTGAENPIVFTAMLVLRSYDDQLVDQALRTALYSVLIGCELGYDEKTLCDLCEAALLHDIGMIRVRPRLWRRAEHLPLNERLEIQKHVLHGADILSQISETAFWTEVVAYQHHEHWNGEGYPRGKRGHGIAVFARIVAVADYFAGRTSPRPHRKPLRPYEAMRKILSESGQRFDPTILSAFLRAVGLYPIGSDVILSDGSTAVVLAADSRLPYRPVVLRKNSETIAPISLAEVPDIVILRAA